MNREHENRSKNSSDKGRASVRSGVRRDYISVSYWSSKFRAASRIHRNDWGTGPHQHDLSIAWWFRYRVTIIFASTGAFGIGLAQMIMELVNR